MLTGDKYTQGIIEDSACILKDGELIPIDEIVETLNKKERELESFLDELEDANCLGYVAKLLRQYGR